MEPAPAIETEASSGPIIEDDAEGKEAPDEITTGRKFDVLKELLAELEDPFWKRCYQVDAKLHRQYFDTKYNIFRDVCPKLYERALDGRFQNYEAFEEIMQRAGAIASGQTTKEKADEDFAWWAAQKRGIARGGGRGRGAGRSAPTVGRGRGRGADHSWLLNN